MVSYAYFSAPVDPVKRGQAGYGYPLTAQEFNVVYYLPLILLRV